MQNKNTILTKDQFTKLHNSIRKLKIEPLIIKADSIEIKYYFEGDLSHIDYDEAMEQYVYSYYVFDQLKTTNKLIQKLYEHDPQSFEELLSQEYEKTIKSYESRCSEVLTKLLLSLTDEEKEAWETMRTFDDDYNIKTVYETYLDGRSRANEIKTELGLALELVKKSGYSVVKSSDFI